MGKGLLIVRSNLRRTKGQTAAIIVLVLLASCMLNLWLMLAMDYKQNFERYHDKLNAEHVTLAITGQDEEMREYIARTLEEDPRTLEYRMDDCMEMVGTLEYNGGDVNTDFVIMEKETALTRSIGRAELVEERGPDSGVYIPMLYAGIQEELEEEKLKIALGSGEAEYELCGFTNSVMAGSHNCYMALLALTPDQYEALKGRGIAPEATLVSVRLRDKAESAEYEAMLKNVLASRYPSAHMRSNSYEMVITSRYISQMICSGIVSAMAFFVLLIALVVIASNIINYIQENMQKLGALKAVGYTSGQLIGALLLQFLGIALTAALLGAGLSYCLFPALNAMMISQTGIPYGLRFLPLPFLGTLAVIGGAVALAVWLSARRVRKIDPIAALRQGVLTHSFRRNFVPLDKSAVPLQLALALKTTLSFVKQNVTVCITVMTLSLVVVFAGLMTENMIVDMTPFIQLIVGETADSCIDVNAESEEEFLSMMEADGGVEKVYLFHTADVGHVGGKSLMAMVSEDFTQVNNQAMCFRGRFPKYDNEVALGAKYAGERELEIGDEITLTADGREAVYLITGYTQFSNNLGEDCMLTREGYERMGRLRHVGYYINMAEGQDVEEFNVRVSEALGAEINAAINIEAVLSGSTGVYVSMMKIIVAAILVLSVVVIAFVLYLLVRSLLNTKKRDYGILKAMGYTSGQLILQTALSFMPVMILSLTAGLAVCAVIINPLTALFLQGIGIVECTFRIPVRFIVLAGMGLAAFAFGVLCLLSLKVRRIAPRTLLVQE